MNLKLQLRLVLIFTTLYSQALGSTPLLSPTSVWLNDAGGNPIGSSTGALFFNVGFGSLVPNANAQGHPLLAPANAWLSDGYGNPLTSTLGSLNVNCVSGCSGGGAVTSVFGRTGVVTAQSGDYTTALVTEGANLYFTNARAIAATLTGYSSGAGTVSSADSILSAIQKLNGNTAALVTGVSSVSNSNGTLTISPTTGAVVASRAAITGDVSVPAGSNTSTFATVNSNVGSFTNASITVNAKGLVTAASTGSGGGSGTVTSVAQTVPAFLNISGSPVTTSGTLALSLSGTAIPTTSGGTGTNQTLTSGSVLFVDGSGNVTQDNSKFKWDDTAFQLQLGGHLNTAGLGISQSGGSVVGFDLTTTNSNTAFQIENQGAQVALDLTTAANSATQGGTIILSASRGTNVSRLATQAADQVGLFAGQSYNGSSFGPGYNGAIGFIATEAQTASHNGGQLVVATTANGALAPTVAATFGQDQSTTLAKQLYINGGVAATNDVFVMKDGHFKSTNTTAPTVTVNANAGTGASCTIAHASDVAGTITIVSGSVATPATGDQCQVNFNKAYATAPVCVIQPANVTAGTDLVQSYVNNATVSTTIMTVAFAVAAATTATYIYNYHCIETL